MLPVCGDVDDAAPALFNHWADKAPDGLNGPDDVGGEGPLPVGVNGFEDGDAQGALVRLVARAEGCVVDKDVHRAESVDDGGIGVVQLLVVGDVAVEGQGQLVRVQLLAKGLLTVPRAFQRRDSRARLQECLCVLGAHASARAGYDHHEVSQFSRRHALSPLPSPVDAAMVLETRRKLQRAAADRTPTAAKGVGTRRSSSEGPSVRRNRFRRNRGRMG